MAPSLDDRDEAAFIQRMEQLARFYTPEWRLNMAMPDMGTTLARLFARIMEETVRDYNCVPGFHQQEFMKAAGCEAREAERAEGFMAFGLTKPDMPELLLPSGWGVISKGDQGSVSMETKEDVYVSAASVRMEEDMPALHDPVCKEGMDNCCWRLLFDRPIVKGVISLLFVVDMGEGPRDRNLTWEYHGGRGWTYLAVEDGTKGFCHTGILKFAATQDFCSLEDGGCWCVRVRGEGGDRLPRQMPSVFMNGAAVSAVDAGTRGNLKPGATHRLRKTAGFVSILRNPDYFSGGSEKESAEEAADRTSASLRHQFRAVTPRDYELLVREVCRDAVKIRCFPGYDGAGNKKWGTVTVVVFRHPGFFEVKEQLMELFSHAVSETLLAGNGFDIVAPRFIRMDVEAVLCVRSMGLVMDVQARASKELDGFLNPISGGYDGYGWEFGILPDYMHIKNFLQRIPDTAYIKQLSLQCQGERDGRWEAVSWETAASFPWSLPFLGRCQMDVEVG